MPTVTSLGAGSGLDLNTVVSGLMSVERQPLTAVQQKLSSVNADISAIGKLRSALSTFQTAMDKLSNASAFDVHSTTSSDEDVLTATAASGAAKGSYALEVTRIAEYHRLAAGTALANSDVATVGSSGDTMTIDVGGEDFTVTIGGKTLEQVRDAINDASDNSGVTASIIKDNSGYRLLLSANDTGSENFVSTSYSGADPFSLAAVNTDRNSSGTFTAADLDAVLKLEGQFDITSSSNTLTDTIDGVTLTLKSAGTTTINVARDDDAIKKSAESFASATSDLFNTLESMRNGSLGDYGALLRGIETRVRSILGATVGSGSNSTSLSDVGLETQRDGSLKLDSEAFISALQSDFSNLTRLFTDSTDGLAVQLDDLMTSYLQSGGIIDSQKTSLEDRAQRLETQSSRLEARLELVQDRYTKQFSALDSLVANLQQTSRFLNQLFS